MTDTETEETSVSEETNQPPTEQTLSLPPGDDEVANLRAGEWVYVSGSMLLVGRSACKELREHWDDETTQSFIEPTDSVLFAEAGQAPMGKVIGSIEPIFIEQQSMLCCALLDAGVRCIIGSGPLNPEAQERLKKKHGLYLVTLSGAGALLSRTVHQSEVVACETLGHEAIRRLNFSRLPCVVALDGFGRYLFQRP
jgi:fumarate hydratase subunit beta